MKESFQSPYSDIHLRKCSFISIWYSCFNWNLQSLFHCFIYIFLSTTVLHIIYILNYLLYWFVGCISFAVNTYAVKTAVIGFIPIAVSKTSSTRGLYRLGHAGKVNSVLPRWGTLHKRRRKNDFFIGGM